MAESRSASGRKSTKAKTRAPRIERERRDFTKLLALNPNYFGNLPELELKVQKEIALNTRYEALTCVGFSPERDLLTATISIKLSQGYGGDLCQAGSREYVRFYVDYGAGWEDADAVGVEVHDLAAGTDCEGDAYHPIEYIAALAYDPRRRFCGNPTLPRVRAILSWNLLPPAGQPDWKPVWGDVHECSIQISPRFLLPIDIFEELKPKLPEEFELPDYIKEIIEGPLPPLPPPPPPPPLGLEKLAQLYEKPSGRKAKDRKGVAVEPHRFGLPDLYAALNAPSAAPLFAHEKAQLWKSLELDWGTALEQLEQTSGNTNYEELECVGLDNNADALVATFRVKLSSGYSGGPCTAGSIEHVAFWVDWHDTCEWTYLDTVKVSAHDFTPLPDGGLCYSAVLPVDLSQVRRQCEDPVIGRVRAVLSWNSPPSTLDPDHVPYWGNRVDVHVQVRPGIVVDPANPVPLISILSGVETGMVNDVSGLTTPGAVFADNGLFTDWVAPHSRACPFAGIVTVKGPSFPGHRYRVLVRKVGEGWTPVTTSYRTVDLFGNGTNRFPDPLTGWTDYLPWFQNISGMLGRWFSAGDALWEVGLEIQGVPGIDIHRIQLDNTLPDPIDLQITGGNCGKFNIGTTMQGTFVARDSHFAQFTIGTSPFSGPVVPSSGTLQTPATGSSWELDTTGMQACGYVIVLNAYDLAIVNSASTGRHRSVSRGFCLE